LLVTQELKATTARLSQWLDDGAEAFLCERMAARMTMLLEQLREVRQCLDPQHREVPICFLGNAGVGKSTLVNALVDPQILVVPAGGVGPLTAQATLVRHSEQPYLRARYHGAKRVNQLVFALQMYLRRADAAEASAAPAAELDEDSRLEILSALPDQGADASDREAADERIRSYINQARLMVTGKQFGDEDPGEVEYLVQAMRASLAASEWIGERVRPADRANVERLARALRKDVFHLPLADRASFLTEIRLHASGSLAPLIKSLEVGWNSRTLPPGLVVVDLPGIGIANDEFRTVTSSWIRRAEAVVLVVDRAGVSEASVEMLRTTGYLNALLHRAPDSPQISPLLWIAVVKLDDVAKDERTAFQQEHPEERPPSWQAFFEDACTKGEALVREQFARALPNGRNDAEERAVNARLLEQLQVFAVSAPQYRKVVVNDEEDRPHIRSEADSKIPRLSEAMHSLVARHHQALDASARRTLGEIREALELQLRSVLDELSASDRKQDSLRQLRARFEASSAPLSRELAARSGALREALRATIPLLIERQVAVATAAAAKKLAEYLRPLQRKSWATLRATVRRGGVFIKDKTAGSKRNLDLPNEMALRYEAELVPVWNQVVVTEIRRIFTAHAEDIRRILGKVVEWASHPELGLQPDVIQRYNAEVASDLTQMAQIAERRTDQLREQIKQKLYQRIEERVRLHCQQFVDAQRDVGTGVGTRVKELLEELPAVLGPAVYKMMNDYLKEVYEHTIVDLGERFATISDPIARAGTLLLAEPGGQDPDVAARRAADRQRAQALLEELSAVFAGVEA
jgi:Dynamin family